MKALFNIFGPIAVAAYSIAFAVSHSQMFEEYTKHPYAITTFCFIIVGCIVWLLYGVATFDDYC